MAILDSKIERRAREAITILAREIPVVTALLFGSHVEGRTHEFSDIDLAVYVSSDSLDLFRRADLARLVHEAVGNDIQLHYFSANALNNPEPASFASYVLRHGVRLELDEQSAN